MQHSGCLPVTGPLSEQRASVGKSLTKFHNTRSTSYVYTKHFYRAVPVGTKLRDSHSLALELFQKLWNSVIYVCTYSQTETIFQPVCCCWLRCAPNPLCRDLASLQRRISVVLQIFGAELLSLSSAFRTIKATSIGNHLPERIRKYVTTIHYNVAVTLSYQSNTCFAP